MPFAISDGKKREAIEEKALNFKISMQCNPQLTCTMVDRLSSNSDPAAIRMGRNVLSTKIINACLYRWLLFIQFDLKISRGSDSLAAYNIDPAYAGKNISVIMPTK